MGIRRYRVKYSVHPGDGAYHSKTIDFRSLRAVGEFIRDMPGNTSLLDVAVLEILPLSAPERRALSLFSDGKFSR